MAKRNVTPTCLVCGRPIPDDMRSDATYDSPRCRQYAYRVRQRIKWAIMTGQAPVRLRPLLTWEPDDPRWAKSYGRKPL